MGQVNQCCRTPFTQAKFDINQVRIHSPLIAEEILALRQINNDIKLSSHHQNVQKQEISEKTHQRIYKEIITREYCFFGYINSLKHGEQEQVCETQNSEFLMKKTKKSLNPRKDKQNDHKLSFVSTSLKLNDFGILIHRDKACYKGTFRNNKYHGRGCLSIVDSEETFEGLFQNGMKVLGTYQNQQIKYTGQFKNDQMEGQGVLKFKLTGQHYEGGIKNGKMSGKGKIIYPNGDSYEGCFQNGLYHGEGTYVWPNGDTFSGTYKKGVKHGFGILSIDGVSKELCWVNGKAEAQPVSFQQFKTKKEIQTTRKIINTEI